MKGFMLKDLYTYKNLMKGLLISVGVIIIMCFVLDFSPTFLPPFLLVMFAMQSISLFSYDELAKFDRFACCTPVPRKAIVRARYLLNAGLGLGLAVVSSAFSVGISLLLGRELDLFSLLVTTGVMLCMSFILMAAVMPLSYKFGPEKGRIAITVVYMGIFVLVFGGLRFFGTEVLNTMLEGILLWLAVGLVAAAVLGYGASCVIAGRIYTRKEF